MTDAKTESRIQVIDRAALLMDAIGRYSKPVKLKTLGAETGLAPSTAYRILQSLISHRFVERDSNGGLPSGPEIAAIEQSSAFGY